MTHLQITDPTLRLYAVVRKDLEMSTGKTFSQAAHAYVNTILAADPQIVQQYQADGLGTKVCLVARNLQELEYIYACALEAGITVTKITDSGHVMLPHFDGSPVTTAIGFGPCTREQCQEFTKRLKLL